MEDPPEIYSKYAPDSYIGDMKEFINRMSQLNHVARKQPRGADYYFEKKEKSPELLRAMDLVISIFSI